MRYPAAMTHAPDFNGAEEATRLPTLPGVYRFYGRNGDLLYVGKAKNLRRRVSSYFNREAEDARRASMVSMIDRINTTVTRTEGEALLLEAQLIQTQRPRFNILLREKSGHAYLCFSEGDWPRMFVQRAKERPKGRAFGPFPSSAAVEEALHVLQKAFHLRSCNDTYFRHRSRPCLQHGIGRCSAPCVGLIAQPDYAKNVAEAVRFLGGHASAVLDEAIAAMEKASAAREFENAARWRDRIALLRHVRENPAVVGSGADADAVACRIREGVACVALLPFRNGASAGASVFFPELPPGNVREEDVLGAFLSQHYLHAGIPKSVLLSLFPPSPDALTEALSARAGHAVSLRVRPRQEAGRWVDLAVRNADAALTTHLLGQQVQTERRNDLARLLGLTEPPKRLECFDVSHTQGELPVASCVVFGPHGPLKSAYRRFNLQGLTPGDDYAGMHQAITRRFRRLAAGEGERPDVLLIDGGAGQVAQAVRALSEVGVAGLPVVGVSKGPERRGGEEDLILAWNGAVLHPGPASPGLLLVRAVRDEAHRFALFGHRKRREGARRASALERIPGVGPQRRRALLNAMGGLEGVAASSAEELARVPGIDRALAARIYAVLHGQPDPGSRDQASGGGRPTSGLDESSNRA